MTFLIGSALAPAAALADGEGFYGPLELKSSETQLMKNAGAYEDQFVRRGYRYDAPELEAALSRLGAQLAPKPTDPYMRYRVHVLRDAAANAFALPDGQLYVNTGLLAQIENEAQLAAVLAHEVQHTAGHHGILSYRSARRKTIAGAILGPLTLGVGDYFLAMSVFGYGRDLEEEADRLGAKRMLKAGYDPREMRGLFEILMQDPEGENPDFKSKWNTHPQLEARIAYTQEMIPGLTQGADLAALKVGARGYRSLVRRLSLETAQDLIAADRPRSAVALAKRLVREDESDPAAQVTLGDARLALGPRALFEGEAGPTNKQKLRNAVTRERYTRSEREARLLETPEGRAAQKQNLDSAQQAYMRALALDPGAAEAHRGLGYVLKRQKRFVNAGKEFVIYLRARPAAHDKGVILNEMKDINAAIKTGGKTR
ncbi:MAG TPA: M48 family metalloprotease [Candidatus Polarisedimenticolia bacterium]|jgi:predicted Zn-dependent protease|nr:M48 family metalloprotease [Candidatus Polarisedimenticolia bacterium]